MKKFLFSLLILFSALAVDAKNIDGISYSLNSTDKKAQVKGFAEGVSKSKLVIPDKVTSGGVTYKVTSIAKEAFMGADGLKSVEIGDYVETIGSGAFYASSVKTLVLGERVKIIGGSAFHDTNIESVVFPASLQIIRKLAFRNCEKLRSVSFGGEKLTSIESFAFSWCPLLASFNMPNSVTSLGESVFEDCYGLTKVSISEKLTVIPESAFCGCPIANLTIPASVTAIGKSAFFKCATPHIYIPGSVKSIGDWAFENSTCQSVHLNEGIASIGEYAFYETTQLKAVSIPSSVTSIGTRAFMRSAVENVQLSGNVKVIPEGLFYESNLKSLEIPQGVTEIGEWAFRMNPNLTDVTIAGSVKTIGKEAFDHCNIDRLLLGEGIEVIGNGAFYGLEVENLTLPKSVKSIGQYAFNNNVFNEVRPQNSVPCQLDEEGFSSWAYSDSRLVVPDGSLEAYRTAPGWRQFANIETVSGMSGIEDVVEALAVEPDDESVYYDMSGARTCDPESGKMYIKVDKTSKKRRVVVRRHHAR